MTIWRVSATDTAGRVEIDDLSVTARLTLGPVLGRITPSTAVVLLETEGEATVTVTIVDALTRET